LVPYNSAILQIYNSRLASKPATYRTRYVSYTFYSLFSPSTIKNLGLYLNNSVTSNLSTNNQANYRNKKILIKQSYLLLAWLNVASRRYSDNSKNCGFVFLPSKVSKFTMTKAPMAHKTFSQEQFGIRYRRLLVRLPMGNSNPLNLSGTLFAVGKLHANQLSIGTNLLFTSKVVFSLSTCDNNFFLLN
jgi:hypothetical protein